MDDERNVIVNKMCNLNVKNDVYFKPNCVANPTFAPAMSETHVSSIPPCNDPPHTAPATPCVSPLGSQNVTISYEKAKMTPCNPQANEQAEVCNKKPIIENILNFF